ncbi:hypothetical protein [Blastopirellula marina]|uniref:Uncharacterized protein n=1 Tax=Blastopirellula marina TaxID=124 RepID=A0A2S8GP31_9BACT|nr:hypothetical protein [Blastopirellula marina]PQO46178.1 hypothetical protein C5Y93_09310 [Blastopirellula marina]
MSDEQIDKLLTGTQENPLEKRAWQTAPTRMYVQVLVLVALGSMMLVGVFGEEVGFLNYEIRLALAGIGGFYVGCGSGNFGKRLLVGFFAVIALGLQAPHFRNEPLQDLGLVLVATALVGMMLMIFFAWADWRKETFPHYAGLKLLTLVVLLLVLLGGANQRFTAIDPNAALQEGLILATRGAVFALAVALQLLPLRAASLLRAVPYLIVALIAFLLAPAVDGVVRSFEGVEELWGTTNLYRLSLAGVWLVGYPLHFALGALDLGLVAENWKQTPPKQESPQEEFHRLADSRFSLHP